MKKRENSIKLQGEETQHNHGEEKWKL